MRSNQQEEIRPDSGEMYSNVSKHTGYMLFNLDIWYRYCLIEVRLSHRFHPTVKINPLPLHVRGRRVQIFVRNMKTLAARDWQWVKSCQILIIKNSLLTADLSTGSINGSLLRDERLSGRDSDILFAAFVLSRSVGHWGDTTIRTTPFNIVYSVAVTFYKPRSKSNFLPDFPRNTWMSADNSDSQAYD